VVADSHANQGHPGPRQLDAARKAQTEFLASSTKYGIYSVMTVAARGSRICRHDRAIAEDP
jgi:hypothetical protein